MIRYSDQMGEVSSSTPLEATAELIIRISTYWCWEDGGVKADGQARSQVCYAV